jgi:hypothetical protein
MILTDPQTRLAFYVNQEVRQFLDDNPDTTLDEVLAALEDAKTDAPAVFEDWENEL